ncbi:MAG TPA: cytochrome c [Gemmatimonadales bacterium]|jgi:mono/diheme cytochrome c family protein
MRKVVYGLVLLALTGCNWWYNDVPSPDDVMHAIPWFDHMLMTKSVQPYQRADVPRYTPAGSVPVGGGEADWNTGNPLMGQYSFDTLMAKKAVRGNVVARPDSRSGEAVFNTYCAVCHAAGATGSADAPVKEMLAPSLLTAQARGYTDGYLYSMIRYGRGRMPQYGDKIPRIDERWAVVDYLRSLQAKAAAPDAAPAKGAH